MKNHINSYFGLDALQTTVKREILAGFTTFISMAYILFLSLIHISEPTRRTPISYAVFCLKKKKKKIILKKKKQRKEQKSMTYMTYDAIFTGQMS